MTIEIPLSSPADMLAAEAGTGRSLYDRLGGMRAIHAVVDDLTGRTLADADPRRAAAYKANLADFLCQANWVRASIKAAT
jgi:hypothetical protein